MGRFLTPNNLSEVTMKLVKAALMGLALVGLFALPLEQAAARTRCNVTTVNGHVVKRVCTTTRTYRDRRTHYRPYRSAYRSYRPYRGYHDYRPYYRYRDRPYHRRFWNDY